MSKAARAGGKLRRLREKRTRKDTMKAQYKKFAEQGRVKGSKRLSRKEQQKKLSLVSHPNGRCGNPGCKKCFSMNYKPWLNKDGQPEGMSQKLYQSWLRDKQAA